MSDTHISHRPVYKNNVVRMDRKVLRNIPAETLLPPILRDKRIVGVLDIENMSIGARDLGRAISYEALQLLLSDMTNSLDLHACFSKEPNDNWSEHECRRGGYKPHARDIVKVMTPNGVRRFANSDLRMAFTAGRILRQRAFDVVLFGTGDGDLGCELASAARTSLGRQVLIGTMSTPGCLSRRLQISTNPEIDFNIVLGADCLLASPARPAPQSPITN